MDEINGGEITDQVQDVSGKADLRTVAVLGGTMVFGALLWDRVLKPVSKKIREKIQEAKQNHDNKTKVVEVEAQVK